MQKILFEDLLKNILEYPANYTINFDGLISDIAGWDSMTWVALISIIEADFDCEFPFEKIEDLKTVRDLYNCIKELNNGG